MATLILLNRIALASIGNVAPGATINDTFEDPTPWYDAGAIFGDATANPALVELATEMRLRGADWGDMERALLGDAAQHVAGLTQRAANFLCRRLFPPQFLPVPCPQIEVWSTQVPGASLPLILMRGAITDLGVFWAGSIIDDDLIGAHLHAAGYEFSWKPLGPALDFAVESLNARLRGAWTWDECEERAARARLRYAQHRCTFKSTMCPPGWNPPPPNAQCSCNPYTSIL